MLVNTGHAHVLFETDALPVVVPDMFLGCNNFKDTSGQGARVVRQERPSRLVSAITQAIGFSTSEKVLEIDSWLSSGDIFAIPQAIPKDHCGAECAGADHSSHQVGMRKIRGKRLAILVRKLQVGDIDGDVTVNSSLLFSSDQHRGKEIFARGFE